MTDPPPVWMLGERPPKLAERRCWRCSNAGFVRRACIACGRLKVAGGTVINEQLFGAPDAPQDGQRGPLR